MKMQRLCAVSEIHFFPGWFGAAGINKVVKRSRNREVAERPTTAVTVVTQSDFIKSRFGNKAGDEGFRLGSFGCAWPQIRIQPYRHQVIFVRNILHLKNHCHTDAALWKLIIHRCSTGRARWFCRVQINVSGNVVGSI